MVSRLGDRLSDARRRQFVGRANELAVFRSAIGTSELPFLLLYVYGPGGVGKTSLLREFVSLADQAGMSSHYLDARNIEPTPDNFLSMLRVALGIGPSESPVESLSSSGKRGVLLIDTYETLAPLDNWLRDTFLPELPDNLLIVLASREPPTATWVADPGWQSLVRTLPIRNFSPEESRSYLTKREIPVEQHQRILDFTHGHALALSLVVDVLTQRSGLRFEPDVAPDMIKALLERFIQKVPGPAHRAALEACALVRVTTEGLLAQMLTPRDVVSRPDDSTTNQLAHDLFEWLRGLSFIESGREGLFPHDLARDILVADLRWRNPDWYKELHNRARDYYSSRIQTSPVPEQHRILFDYVFLHRDNPVVRSMMDWQIVGGIVSDTMRESDIDSLLSMVEKHEGKDSSKIAAQWLNRQADEVTVCRDEKGAPVGFLGLVSLDKARPDEINSDTATQLAWNFLQRKAPLRPGETAAYYRFWMAGETYQDVSPVQTMIFLNTVRYQLTTPGLAYHFLPVAYPDFWAGPFAYANLERLVELDFESGGRRFGVYGHDWRIEPPLAWLAMLAEREVSAGAPAPAAAAAPMLVLSETEFAEAVQDALRGLARPGGLRGNPLLRSRLVAERVGPSASDIDREEALMALLRELIDSFAASPREARLHKALYHTFVRPEASQERTAELLDLPFSTYRRHLKAGTNLIIRELWQKELGGSQK